MKLLVYGGCHALIIKRMIDELGPDGRHEVDLLINFELVGSGKPFPYETLKSYDAVVYSPVENKGTYNTVHLDEACAAAGVQAVRFPWLEWHGYAPGADKDVFWSHRGWFFPGLIELAARQPSFDAFARAVRQDFPGDEGIASSFAYTTAKLTQQEERVGCEIRVSDFILDGFRDRRMFLIPDHPSLHLYRHVFEQMERLLGASLIASWPADLPEPQPEARTPILPRVAAAARLAFQDTTWRCDAQPMRTMGLDAFLALHFELGQARADAGERPGELALATAVRGTCLSSTEREPTRSGWLPLSAFTQLLLRRGGAAPRGYFQAEILSPIAAEMSDRLTGRHLFREGDWLCRS